MRVAIVVSSLEAGGTERFSTLLASGLSDLDHEVTLVTLTAARRDFFSVPESIGRIALNGDRAPNSGAIAKFRRDLVSLRRLRTSLRSSDSDVIVSLGWATNVITLVASTLMRIPVIISERTDPREHNGGRFWRAMQRLSYPMAKRLVVQTTSVSEAMSSWVLPGRVVVIPNPVVPSAFATPAEPGPTPLVVAMGRMTEEKGFDVLLGAFARVAERFPTARLRIIGDGPLRKTLEQTATDLGIHARVEFPGIIREPHSAMKEAWCACLTSRFEGFPNVLLEAMAMGLPVVATDCRSGPAQLLRGGAGLLVPVGDEIALACAIEQLFVDRDHALDLGQRARARAGEFEAGGIVAQWNSLLAQL